MPTYEERLQTAITDIEALLAKHSAIINGPATGTGSTTAVTGGTVPSLLKLTSDIAAQIVGGYNAGYVVNVTDATARAGATPSVVGQFLYQRDTGFLYTGATLVMGSWTEHPLNATIAGLAAAVAATAALTTTVNGKMTKADYDPSGEGFALDSTDLQEFTSVGTHNYVFPDGLIDRLEVILVGAGAGGGSGRCGSTGANRFGGGGGAAGAIAHFILPGATVEAVRAAAGTIVITIPAGGAGGAAVTTANTNGNAGTNGSATTLTCAAQPSLDRYTFNSLAGGPGLLASGGAGGSGVANSCGGPIEYNLSSCAGGAGGTSAAVAAGNSAGMQPTGGGGGGGTNTSNVAYGGESGGALGTAHTINRPENAGGAAGAAGSTGAKDNLFCGAGGGGGGAGAAGGNGTTPGGGGGGGGGSSQVITTSGAGGTGGNGYARIITHRRHTP